MIAENFRADSVAAPDDASDKSKTRAVISGTPPQPESPESLMGHFKYSLRARSIQRRFETELKQREPTKKQPRVRSRPAQLSKYRRRTANARERDRMRDINVAFELLQQAIPQLPAEGTGKEKVTKITILRLAINYIKALKTILDSDVGESGAEGSEGPPSVGSLSSCSSAETCGTELSCELPDPLDSLEGLTDFQLPPGLDALLDMSGDSGDLDMVSTDFSDLLCS